MHSEGAEGQPKEQGKVRWCKCARIRACCVACLLWGAQAREGTTFVLTKTYREGQGAPPVTVVYEGEADAAFENLHGIWTVAEDPIQSGPFAWSRASEPAWEAILRRVLTPAHLDPADGTGA